VPSAQRQGGSLSEPSEGGLSAGGSSRSRSSAARNASTKPLPGRRLFRCGRVLLDAVKKDVCWEQGFAREIRTFVNRALALTLTFDSDVTTPFCLDESPCEPEDITHFRRDNNTWIWQVRGENANILAYAVTVLSKID
jgi:hypothetical protein